MIRLSLLALILLLAVPLQAQVTTAFTYQGELERNDVAADGTFDFRFQLYDVADGGIPLLSPAEAGNIAVNAGLFTAEVDFGFNVFGVTDLWLELQVRESGAGDSYTSLLPRQKITPAPIATHAMNVEPGAIGSAQVDSSQVQRRITGVCPSSRAIQDIAEDGTVGCIAVPQGDLTAVITGPTSGLDGGCLTGDCSLSVDPTDFNGANPVGGDSDQSSQSADTNWTTIAEVELTSGAVEGEVVLMGNAFFFCGLGCDAPNDTVRCQVGFTSTPTGSPSAFSQTTVGVLSDTVLFDNVSVFSTANQPADTAQTYFLRARSNTQDEPCQILDVTASGLFVPG